MISSVGSLTYARLNPMYLIGVIPKEQLKGGARESVLLARYCGAVTRGTA